MRQKIQKGDEETATVIVLMDSLSVFKSTPMGWLWFTPKRLPGPFYN